MSDWQYCIYRYNHVIYRYRMGDDSPIQYLRSINATSWRDSEQEQLTKQHLAKSSIPMSENAVRSVIEDGVYSSVVMADLVRKFDAVCVAHKKRIQEKIPQGLDIH